MIIDNNKDKLMNLITKAQMKCNNSEEMTNADQIAEYLLANGVVILNHKLGETIYEVQEFCISMPLNDEDCSYELRKIVKVKERPLMLSDIRLQMDIFLERNKAEKRARLLDSGGNGYV